MFSTVNITCSPLSSQVGTQSGSYNIPPFIIRIPLWDIRALWLAQCHPASIYGIDELFHVHRLLGTRWGWLKEKHPIQSNIFNVNMLNKSGILLKLITGSIMCDQKEFCVRASFQAATLCLSKSLWHRLEALAKMLFNKEREMKITHPIITCSNKTSSPLRLGTLPQKLQDDFWLIWSSLLHLSPRGFLFGRVTHLVHIEGHWEEGRVAR